MAPHTPTSGQAPHQAAAQAGHRRQEEGQVCIIYFYYTHYF